MTLPATGQLLLQADPPPDESVDSVEVVCGNAGQLCDLLYEWTGSELVAEAASFFLGVPAKIILIVVLALVVNRLLRRGIRRLTDRLGRVTAHHGGGVVDERNVERAQERASTIGSLLRSFSTTVVFALAALLVLEAVGLSVVAVIASAGVLSLAIGFGAQSIVEDLLRGVFMLGEDQFGVGDRIDVGAVNGYVERVTLRTAVIRDADGTLWHVPNSEIARVANENQLRSRASVEIGVSYNADLDVAMAALDDAVRRIEADPEWASVLDGEHQVQGIQELGDDAVVLRVIVWVDAGERRRFERMLRRRLKDALDDAGIEMPNRQVDVWMRPSSAA